MKRNTGLSVLPTRLELEKEIGRIRYKKKYFSVLKNTVFTLLVVAACAVLVATLMLPVLKTYGDSMSPTLGDGEVVVSVKSSDFEAGDVVAFYYNNKILIKRVIGVSGDFINMTEDGTVYVNDRELYEPYISEKSLGDCNITFPYQVPESKIFVMGDHRSISLDSRNTAIGCIACEQVVGKIVFRLWPLERFGNIGVGEN